MLILFFTHFLYTVQTIIKSSNNIGEQNDVIYRERTNLQSIDKSESQKWHKEDHNKKRDWQLLNIIWSICKNHILLLESIRIKFYFTNHKIIEFDK